MKTIGVGVIGCGFVGYGAHIPGLAAIQNGKLVAVADRDSNRRNKAVKKFSIKSAYEDHTDLLKDPDVNAVVVAVPTPFHKEVSLAAMKAGKHVLCEMPLAPTLEDVDEMTDAAKKAGVVLMPGLTYRFTPNYVKAKEMIKQGKLGEVCAVWYREFIPAKDLARQWPPGSWVWQVDKSGGPLFTLAVWCIDLLRWLLDSDITRVEATAKYTVLKEFGGTLGYDACALLKFANGVVGSIQFSGTVSESAPGSWLDVVGSSTNVLHASGNDMLRMLGSDPARTEWNLKEPGARSWGHQQQDEYFVQCLLDGKQPSITPQDGRRAMEIALKIGKAS